MNNPIKKFLLGDDSETVLPQTRARSFGCYGKRNFGCVVLSGMTCALFFIPALVWLYVMNWNKAQALKGFDESATDFVARRASALLGWSLTTYLVLIPLLMLFFVGVCGLFSSIKRICFNQSHPYRYFWIGIKQNFWHFLLWGAVFGISLFALSVNFTYCSVAELSSVLKATIEALAVIQFVLVCISEMYFVTFSVTYTDKVGAVALNCIKLTFAKFFSNLVAVIVVAIPPVAVLLIPSPFQLLGLGAMFVFYFGFAALGVGCFCNSVYDKVVNPLLGENFVGIGLDKSHK